MTEIPLGQRESLKLEFKSRDSLTKPDSIGREVVAMLNADGGEIWIGLEESDGRAVAIQPIESPEEARRSLRDHLLDTIEPSPITSEVSVDPFEIEGHFLFRIRVEPKPDRVPYAQVRSGGRYFMRRIADRIRPMSRDELFSPRKGHNELEQASARLRNQREAVQAKSKPLLWLWLQPVPSGRINVQDPDLHKYFNNPRQTGNRTTGRNFVNPYEVPRVGKDELRCGGVAGIETKLRNDQSILFFYGSS